MAVSLEVRCPLLDHKVMELLARIPSSFKLRGEHRKISFQKGDGAVSAAGYDLSHKDGILDSFGRLVPERHPRLCARFYCRKAGPVPFNTLRKSNLAPASIRPPGSIDPTLECPDVPPLARPFCRFLIGTGPTRRVSPTPHEGSASDTVSTLIRRRPVHRNHACAN